MIDAHNKKSIYVATIIDSHNYGTTLQAVATRDALEEYGRPIFVDYCRSQWTRGGWVRSYLGDANHSFAVNLMRLMFNIPSRLRSEYVFRGFLKRELELCDSAPYLEGGDFSSDSIYCVGSDQTWNIECNYGLDPVYFLKNVPDSCRKVAFSASFGRGVLDASESETTSLLLHTFRAISVRETSSLKILNSMGIHDGVALKDPVLLCNPSIWTHLSDNASPLSDVNYVLVYMLNENIEMASYGAEVAARRGVPAYMVTFNPLKRAPRGLKAICLPSVEGWLALFRHAGLVVTDSFHGTCFSILFEKPMVIFDPPRFSVRLTDLLVDFNLSCRRVEGFDDAMLRGIDSATIDWDEVRLRLEHERAVAREFLRYATGDHE